MLDEIERDGFFLFTARREPILLNIDYSHIQVPDVHSESSSENSMARTSSLEEVMAKRSSLYDDQKPNLPRFLDYELNMVDASHLLQYREYYEIPDEVKFSVPDGMAVWNSPS
ncbi:hypothetical protein ACOSQ3_016749 [Xanthoceras sorbifolium]